LVVVPKRGLVPSIGREVMTVLLFPYGPMLTVHKVTADCEVSQTFMNVYGTITDVRGVCRTIGGSVS
jgi:hypothetical protein